MYTEKPKGMNSAYKTSAVAKVFWRGICELWQVVALSVRLLWSLAVRQVMLPNIQPF